MSKIQRKFEEVGSKKSSQFNFFEDILEDKIQDQQKKNSPNSPTCQVPRQIIQRQPLRQRDREQIAEDRSNARWFRRRRMLHQENIHQKNRNI